MLHELVGVAVRASLAFARVSGGNGRHPVTFPERTWGWCLLEPHSWWWRWSLVACGGALGLHRGSRCSRLAGVCPRADPDDHRADDCYTHACEQYPV